MNLEFALQFLKVSRKLVWIIYRVSVPTDSSNSLHLHADFILFDKKAQYRTRDTQVFTPQ